MFRLYNLTAREAAVVDIMRAPAAPRYIKAGPDSYVHLVDVGSITVAGKIVTRDQLEPNAIIQGEEEHERHREGA